MQEAVAYPPRPNESRHRWYDFFSYFFNYEDCYTKEEMSLRESITQARSKALDGLSAKYKPLGTFWEQESTNVFEDKSKGGWFSFWSSRLAPRDTLSTAQFYLSEESEHSHLENINWGSLLQAEQMIARYVEKREESTSVERQNHPINYFLSDLQRICYIAAEESNAHDVLKVVSRVSSYIRMVRSNVELLSHEGFFLDDMLDHVNDNIMLQLEAGIEAASLKGDFEELNKKVNGVGYKVKRALHFSANAFKVPSHPPLISSDHKTTNAKHDPTQALIDCADSQVEEVKTTALAARENPFAFKSNPFLEKEDGKMRPKTQLLSSCPDVAIADESPETRQAGYIKGVSHLKEIEHHSKLIGGILSLFNDAGHINMVLKYGDKLIEYATSLRGRLMVIKTDMNEMKDDNKEYARSLVSRYSNAGWFETKMTEEESVFLQNQKNKNNYEFITKGLTGVEGLLKNIEGIISRLNHLSQKYQDVSVQQEKISLVEDISEAIESLKSANYLDITGEQILLELDETPLIEDPATVKKELEPPKKATPLGQESTLQARNATVIDLPKPSSSPSIKKPTRLKMKAWRGVPISALRPKPEIKTSPITPKLVSTEVQSSLSLPSKKEGVVFTHCFMQGEESRQTARKICMDDSYRMTVFPKVSNGTLPENWSEGDTYDQKTCHLVPFEGRPALQCEGEESMIFMQTNLPPLAQKAENIFNGIGGQVALGAVFYQMGKSAYEWWYSQPESIVPASKEEADNLFDSANPILDLVKIMTDALEKEVGFLKEFIEKKYTLAALPIDMLRESHWPDPLMTDKKQLIKVIKEREQDIKWVRTIVDDHIFDLRDFKDKLKREKLSADMIKDKKEDIDYLLAYVTPEVDTEHVKKTVKTLLEKLAKEARLSVRDLDDLECYFDTLSMRRSDRHINIGEYQIIKDQSGLPQTVLQDLAETVFMLKHLLDQTSLLRKSDIIDAKQVVTDLIEQLEQQAPEEGQHSKIDVLEDRLRLSSRYNVWSREVSERPTPQSLFFLPETQARSAQGNTFIDSRTEEEPFHFTMGHA